MAVNRIARFLPESEPDDSHPSMDAALKARWERRCQEVADELEQANRDLAEGRITIEEFRRAILTSVVLAGPFYTGHWRRFPPPATEPCTDQSCSNFRKKTVSGVPAAQ
jgi:hypothetical protein